MILTVMVIVFGTGTILAEPPAIIDSFRSALKNRDIQGFRSLIAPDGLVLVRSYNRHDQGRGADVLFSIATLPANFQVPVANDFPFDLQYLFGWTIRSKSLVSLSASFSSDALAERSVPAVRHFARQIVDRANQANLSFVPTVVRLADDWVILSEASSKQGLLSGALAVFQKNGPEYRLKMVVDLR
ncbi:hypothetical protein EDC14_102517 [Hydrogenispora ethanolica]|uniref:Uncharacterized protein n=1 Tax=Hydrogenispora ethanolica TaxID=1082276 RepID=A0A4R1R9N7_HYDET|nr:hypothetical protein EDC14_102517 [Hydrogenispora ethanolica]